MFTKKITLVLLLAVLFIPSCEKETQLSVTQTKITFPCSGGTQVIPVTANKELTAESSADWCHVTMSEQLTVRCDSNGGYDPRSCTIKVTCSELTVSISVEQQETQLISTDKTKYTLSKDHQTVSIGIKANVGYSVDIDQSWIKLSGTKGLSESTIVLEIEENTGYDERLGNVNVTSHEGDLGQHIEIRQSAKNGLELDQHDYSVGHEGGDVVVSLRTNTSIDVVIPEESASWLSLCGNTTKGLTSESPDSSEQCNKGVRL